MLVLSRKRNERIMIGDDVVITICNIGTARVSIGIEAPRDISISRFELPPLQADVMEDGNE